MGDGAAVVPFDGAASSGGYTARGAGHCAAVLVGNDDDWAAPAGAPTR